MNLVALIRSLSMHDGSIARPKSSFENLTRQPNQNFFNVTCLPSCLSPEYSNDQDHGSIRWVNEDAFGLQDDFDNCLFD